MKSLDGIICGDSDKIIDEMINRNEKYDLVLTDPPYNINKDFGNDSDKLSLANYIDLTNKRIEKIKQVLKPYGSIAWFGIHDYIGYIQIAMYNAGLFYRRLNIWHYTNGFSRKTKEPATHYEPFLWFSMSDKKWTYNCDEVRVPYKSTERLKSPVKYKDSNGKEKIWTPNPKGSMRGDVWSYPTLSGKRFQGEKTSHPTQKPEALITDIIKAFCPMNKGKFEGRILDPFHGSGTLGVCCEKLNKQGNNIAWTGIEIEKQWCDIAEARLKNI